MKVVKTYSREECLKRSLIKDNDEQEKLYYLPDYVFDTYLNVGYRLRNNTEVSEKVYDPQGSAYGWEIPREFIEDILDGNRDDFIK